MSETETVTKDEAHYTAEMNALREELERERERRRTAEANAAELKRKFEFTDQQNDQLREELNQMTIAKARLEGYIDRAREFDPKPEPTMVPIDEHPAYRGQIMAADSYGWTTDAKETPWYKMRRP